MKRLIVIRGPPGAGKTSLSEDLFRKLPGKAWVLHKDWFQFHLMKELPNKGRGNAFELELVEAMAALLLRKGFTVIIDGVYGGPRGHLKLNRLKRIARTYRAKYLQVFLDVSLEKCIQRNLRRKKRIPESHLRKWYGWLYEAHGERGIVIESNKLTRKQTLRAIMAALRSKKI